MVNDFKSVVEISNDKKVYLDEYSAKLFNHNSNNYIVSINNLKKIRLDKRYIINKVKRYRLAIIKILNQFHNTRETNKYWGRIIDPYILFIVKKIYFEKKLLQRIDKKKYKLTFLKNLNFFLDTKDVQNRLCYDYNTISFFRFLIFNLKKKISFKLKYNKKKIKKNIFNKFYNFIFKFYLKIFRPIVFVNIYFNYYSKVALFFLSFGKLVFIDRSVILSDKKTLNYNKFIRQKICVKEKDDFDIAFNQINKFFFPKSLLEDFQLIRNKIFFYSDYIKKIGTSINQSYCDHYNILSSELKKKGKKSMTFQHGGFYQEEILNHCKVLDSSYSDKEYFWNTKDGIFKLFLGNNLLKYKNENTYSKILLFPTVIRTIPNNHKIKINSHPKLNQLIKFYNSLNEYNKKNCSIKYFPNLKNSLDIKKYKKNFKNIKVEISKKSLNQSRIIILNDFSTPILELLYTEVPFIILYEGNYQFMDIKFKKYVNNLINLGLVFKNEVKAAEFLNSKINNIPSWWSEIKSNKKMIELKNKLISEKIVSYKKIIHKIKKNS